MMRKTMMIRMTKNRIDTKKFLVDIHTGLSNGGKRTVLVKERRNQKGEP